MICFVTIIIILENIENSNNYGGKTIGLCGILSWVPQMVAIITFGVLVEGAMLCQYGQDSAKHNAFTMEYSKRLLPTITARQLKLWQLVERSASASQSTCGNSGIVCCFAVGALIGIALLFVLSGRVLTGILV